MVPSFVEVEQAKHKLANILQFEHLDFRAFVPWSETLALVL